MRRKLIERNTPPEWNVRVMDEEDFWFHCGVGGIAVRFAPMERLGFYTCVNNQPRIYVHEKLRGPERLYTCLHELAHHWLHPLGIQFFRCWEDAIEKEADCVAACAMIPLSVLRRYSHADIAEMYGYPADMIEFRQMIFNNWKI